MPAVKDLKTKDYHIIVWKIEEDLAFFSRQIKLSYKESQEFAFISNESRKLEWLASRFVQRQLINDSLVKDSFGKPNLENAEGFISISHCKKYAAAIYSKSQKVGVDVEPIHPKVLRIIDKFLSKEEQSLLNKEEKVQDTITAWSVKETAYKWFGKKDLSFKKHMQIYNLSLSDGYAMLHFQKDEFMRDLKISTETISNLVLAFFAQK